MGRRGPVVVRPARPEDAARVLAIHKAVLAESSWFITTPAEFLEGEADKRQLITWLNRQPHSCLLVAVYEDEVKGYVSVRGGELRRIRHLGRLEVMVEESARGLGLGKAMMDACIQWATDNFFLSKLSLSVFADNERAIALYRSFGFEAEGSRKREYRMEDGTFRDDLLMGRWVD